MTKLKEYMEKEKMLESKSVLIPSPNILAKVIEKDLIALPQMQLSNMGKMRFSSTEASIFSHKVSELATSTEVITELSNEIGVPTSHETEDEFVKRAKLTMKKILKRKLSK